MIDARARFSVLHEIGHYLLPDHRYSMYLCDDEGLGYQSRFQFEREANEFAAKLLFNGNRFRLDANSIPLSAKTVESLAKKYRASFEATARRLVEYSFRPCMLIVFMQEQTHDRVNINTLGKWRVRYCIPSSQFSRHYFSRLEGTFSGDKYDEMSRPGHSIAESLIEEVQIETRDGEKRPFMAECFSNTYNIFCFLQPLQKQVLKGT